MLLSIITETDSYPIEVSDDLELENFKVLCEAETGIKSVEVVVVFNNIVLTDDKKPIKDYGVKNGDLLMVMTKKALIERASRELSQRTRTNSNSANPNSGMDVNQFDFGGISVPGARSTSRGAGASQPRPMASAPSTSQGNQDDPAVIRDMLLANPEQLALLKQNNAKLAEALTSKDFDRFSAILKEQQEAKREKERQRIKLLTADPFDMEAQKLIATEIAQENINANMEAAMEFNPESFGVVHMLYINCKVNGHPVKAFIDSGAQTTIMSQACAERCNIMRLVDNRWAGIAKGVGTQKIIGRVHMGQIQIEGDYLASSFCILEEQPMDMLLGLDMLKRHQMCISLKDSQLTIGTTGSVTPFLAESELPDCARLTSLTEENIKKESGLAAMQSEDQELAKALSESAQEQAQAESVSPMDATSEIEVPESDIKELMQIGFAREAIIEEFKKQNGNKTQTTAALFAKNIQFK